MKAITAIILLFCLSALAEFRIHYWEDSGPPSAIARLYWSTNPLAPDFQWKLVAQGGIEVGRSNQTRFMALPTDLPPGIHYLFGRLSNDMVLTEPSNITTFTNSQPPVTISVKTTTVAITNSGSRLIIDLK